MKKALKGLSIALCATLWLTGCELNAHPKGGEYTTANFTFTVPDTCKLLEKEEHSYEPYVKYTFCSTKDKNLVITVSEHESNATPKAVAEDYKGDDFSVYEIPQMPYAAWCNNAATETDGVALRKLESYTGCEGMTLTIYAKLPDKDVDWYNETVKAMFATVKYSGEILQDSTYTEDWITVQHTKDWTAMKDISDGDEEERLKVSFVRSNAQTAGQRNQLVGFQCLSEETLSPEEKARELYEHESEYRQDKQLSQGELFGHPCYIYSFTFCHEDKEIQEDSTQYTSFFFTHEGKLYAVAVIGPLNLNDALLAELETAFTPEF